MRIRTFWTIFIKILGIWLVLDCVTVIPQSFTSFSYLSINDDSQQVLALTLASLLLTIGGYIFVLWLFVFKTSWLIDKLHLEKGFTEEKIELNIQRSPALTIATIVIGGLMFIDALPDLCKEAFNFFNQLAAFRKSPSSEWIIFYIAKTSVGYLLMTNSLFVVDFLERKMGSENGINE